MLLNCKIQLVKYRSKPKGEYNLHAIKTRGKKMPSICLCICFLFIITVSVHCIILFMGRNACTARYIPDDCKYF